MLKVSRLALPCLLAAAILTGCAATSKKEAQNLPPMPEKITAFEDGVPVLEVYVAQTKQIEKMTLEEYLCGVLAGEMKSDWPMEALKAQAILARTFVLKFMTEKESKYGGADISTDIEEAQAYDAQAVNEHIRQAVEETRGKVLSANAELPYAWFHAHSGGKTARAKEGLNWKDPEPGYTRVADGREGDDAPADASQWRAEFSAGEVIAAAKAAGVAIDALDAVAVGDTGESGRATTLRLGNQDVNAPDFRIAIGSTAMRSTFLTDLRLEGGRVIMEGKGFGHGVGMSQWGAYALANGGMPAEKIVLEYFTNVEVVKMY